MQQNCLRAGPNTARKINKYRNSVSKMDEITIPHLDPFNIGHTYLKLNPYSMFTYLKNICTICPYILVVQLSLLIKMDKMASWQTYE